MFTRSILLAVGAASLALFSSCATRSTGGELAAYHAYDVPTKLPANPGALRVKVSLAKQRVYVMEGSNILMAMPVSVGTPDKPTPAGNFTIFRKNHKHRANSRVPSP